MPWTVPDKGEGDNDLQSILFQEYLDVLVDGINGLTCVVSGCLVTGGATMTPNVAKGAVLSNGNLFAVAAGTVTIGTADATNPRIDLIVIDSAGAKQVRAGTAAANPKPAVRSANDVVLAAVYVPAGATAIATSKITDMRLVRSSGVVLKKTTAAVTINNLATAQTYFTITLPNGLFAAGKVLRVRCGGNYLSSGSAATWTLTIAYGGTTLFADVTATTTATAVRGAWYVEFDLVAQASNDQALVGRCRMSPVGAKTAPATGIGDIALTADVGTPLSGGATVDSDAADRTLTVQWTMSVANATVETVMEYGVAELL